VPSTLNTDARFGSNSNDALTAADVTKSFRTDQTAPRKTFWSADVSALASDEAKIDKDVEGFCGVTRF
jgi:hypothetical protein